MWLTIGAVPAAAGVLAVLTRGCSVRSRLGRWLGTAIVLAAIAIAWPIDPRIPHTEHMALTRIGFVQPLLATAAVLLLVERRMPSTSGSRAFVFSLGVVLGAGFLIASALSSGETGELLRAALASP